MSVRLAGKKALFPPHRLITPVTGVLALVIGLSGILLFFHYGEFLVKAAHEWLGLLLVAFMLLHLSSHWPAFKRHFHYPQARWGALATILASGIFITASLVRVESAGPEVILHAVEAARVDTLAALFDVDEERLMDGMEAQGLTLSTGGESLGEAALASGMSGRKSIGILLSVVTALRPE